MAITFLHLSDLHYRPDWHEETELVLKRFSEDLNEQIKRHHGDIYLIFSGDLVVAGGTEDLYTKFLPRLSELLDLAGIPRERRICVPGNHDVSQEAIKSFLQIQIGALNGLTEESLFNDNVPYLSKVFFSATFENYCRAEKSFAHFSCCADSLGGCGWDLPGNVGVYCLNTALCSFGALKTPEGAPISDRNRLMVDTRSLYKWLGSTTSSKRVLIMHHPLDWLADWSKTELERVIATDFQLVFSGHLHEANAQFSTRGTHGAVHVVAPPLFTRKGSLLGYGFVSLDIEREQVEIDYRQWSPAYKFVAGSSLAGEDSGTVVFPRYVIGELQDSALVDTRILVATNTRAILQAEFDEAAICYSARPHTWVDRDLANIPENHAHLENAVVITQHDLVTALRSCIIRAPKEFGLTCLGRFLALDHFIDIGDGTVVVMLDALKMQADKPGVIRDVNARCKELGIESTHAAAFVLDNARADKRTSRIVKELQAGFHDVPIILLQGVDDTALIAERFEADDLLGFDTYFLWALTRPRIRELVKTYVRGLDHLDDDLLTKKVTDDLDALNIHRTPLNCLLILKMAEQAFEYSPVNRTEMIHRVLTLLFFQFDQIPTYATRPDLKDCEYALGYFCERLIRTERADFSREEFHRTISEYCTAQLIDLDIEVLFAFLAMENILVRRGHVFEFRFNYWLYFFAAHRMHHDRAFCEFILSDRRYSAYPELVEFYAGIDRRRADAVERLTADLKTMNDEFIHRAGIAKDFNPFDQARWVPDADAIEAMRAEIESGMAGSSLPSSVKDAVADATYDRARPYNQELARFIQESSLHQLMKAVRGAARVLRNSDHVFPAAKTELLDQVIACWTRICQLLAILCPVLAVQRNVRFEDVIFVAESGFNEDASKRLTEIATVIPDNVVGWFQEDLFSRRMGPLLASYGRAHEEQLGEFLAILVMCRQRPHGWEKEAQRFIVRSHKNSFYLGRLFELLHSEFRVSFSTERTKQELLRLAGMAVAKHQTGAKHPNTKLIDKAVKALEEQKG